MAEFGKMVYYDLSDLEARLGRVKMRWFVRESEAEFLRMAGEIADRAAWNPNIKAVVISGPSSSGKTTFCNRLAGALHMLGRPTTTLHLDDYYKEERTRTDDKGRPDFESIDTLEMGLVAEHIDQLFAGQTIQIPEYDFVERKRHFSDDKTAKLEPRAILLVEGLHGLSSLIEKQLDPETSVRVFIMPYATLTSDRKLLTPRDIRILRRISRDVNHRGCNPLSTLDYWPMMDYSENSVFPEYLKSAHVFLNSAMPYEFFVIAPMAGALIKKELEEYSKGILHPSVYVTKGGMYADLPLAISLAHRLVDAVEDIPRVSPDVVPDFSILNEFMR